MHAKVMRGGLLAAIALVAVTAGAQTNDHMCRSWSWRTELGVPRAMGLGGAAVAVIEDSTATWLNPAGLARLRKTEFAAGGLFRQSGTSGAGDETASRNGLGFVSGAALLTPRWAIGGYLIEPHAVDYALTPGLLGDGTTDNGSMKTIVTEVGGAVAWRVNSRLDLGARVTLSHLESEGVWMQTRGSAETLTVGTSAGVSRLTASFGAVLHVSDALQLGILGDTGVSYENDRTAVAPETHTNLEVGGLYDLRQPARVASGCSWRLSPKVLVAAQLDYVRYSEIQTSIRYGAGTPAEYALDDAVEPRAGLEVSLPTKSGTSVQLRAGVHQRGVSGVRYAGANGVELATWPGEDAHIEVGGGLSVSRRSVKIDVGVVSGGLRSALTVALTVRP